jgi:DNA-binding NtrC family response regulator
VARFLLVDDSPTVRLALAAAIRNAHRGALEIVEAGDADEALRQFEAARPDVVFLDMMLGPGRQGSDVLREILKRDPASKVVLVTGLAPDDPQVKQAIGQGAFALLQKPTRTDAVRRILHDIETEAGRFGRIR